MEYLYHGSCMAGITKLQAISRLHNTQELVVYLTDFVPMRFILSGILNIICIKGNL